ncbi:MAG: PTS glucose transporter subunit IIA [Merdibacter sp.]
MQRREDVSLISERGAVVCTGQGTCVPLEQVPDAMFAQKLLGDGVAFVFRGDTISAPCSGEVVMTAQTRHALGIEPQIRRK